MSSSSKKTLRIASRESALALWQSEYIKSELETLHPGLIVEIVGMTTRGDQILDVPLAKVGGKGLFVKELEQSLFRKETDIAVHSMKDVPMLLPDGLILPVICKRETPLDAFVSNRYTSIEELPAGARIGTSSLRRSSQLKHHHPDCEIVPLRGNVNTRLAKLDAGDFDAIILAAAGLVRLGFEDRIKALIEPNASLPAVGQGALGIECREDDDETRRLIEPLLHTDTMHCVSAERAFSRRLEGGCQVPIAGYATLENQHLKLDALVASLDGKTVLRQIIEGPAEHADQLGLELAERLLMQGAGDILNSLSSL